MSLVTDYVMKTGDRGPSITATCRDASGQVVSLSGASVRFIMRSNDDPAGTPKVAASATIVDAPNGVVRYDWQSADTDTPGLFDAEFEVTFSGSLPQTFPNDRHIVVYITGDLD